MATALDTANAVRLACKEQLGYDIQGEDFTNLLNRVQFEITADESISNINQAMVNYLQLDQNSGNATKFKDSLKGKLSGLGISA